MAGVKQFSVGDRTFNAGMASAAAQDNLLSLLTQRLTEQSYLALIEDAEVDDDLIAGFLMNLNYDHKQKVASILLPKVFIEGTAAPVDVKDFEGRMVEYNQLLAKLLRWNLEDFFTWLLADLKKTVEKQRQQEKPAQ